MKLGGPSAIEVREIIHGTAVFAATASVATAAIASASAAVNGLTTSHKVILFPQAGSIVAAEGHLIVAAACIANGIQITARNMSGSTTAGLTSQSAQFFAWR